MANYLLTCILIFVAKHRSPIFEKFDSTICSRFNSRKSERVEDINLERQAWPSQWLILFLLKESCRLTWHEKVCSLLLGAKFRLTSVRLEEEQICCLGEKRSEAVAIPPRARLQNIHEKQRSPRRRQILPIGHSDGQLRRLLQQTN